MLKLSKSICNTIQLLTGFYIMTTLALDELT